MLGARTGSQVVDGGLDAGRQQSAGDDRLDGLPFSAPTAAGDHRNATGAEWRRGDFDTYLLGPL